MSQSLISLGIERQQRNFLRQDTVENRLTNRNGLTSLPQVGLAKLGHERRKLAAPRVLQQNDETVGRRQAKEHVTDSFENFGQRENRTEHSTQFVQVGKG